MTMIYWLLRNFSDVAVNVAFVMTGNLKKNFFLFGFLYSLTVKNFTNLFFIVYRLKKFQFNKVWWSEEDDI